MRIESPSTKPASAKRLGVLAVPIAVCSVALMGLGLPFLVATMAPQDTTSYAASLPPLEMNKVIKGHELFATTCVACHGVDAKGVASLGKDLTSGFAFNTSDDELTSMIMRGRQPGEKGHTAVVPMPPKGGRLDFTRDDIRNIVMYLRGLQDPTRLAGDLPPLPVAAVAQPEPIAAAAIDVKPEIEAMAKSAVFDREAAVRGKKVFTSCMACHGKNGTGMPNLGADLVHSAFVTRSSDSELVAFIKKGRMPTDPDTRLKLTMPPKGGNPALKDNQLADVVAYLRSLQAAESASR